MPAIATVPSFPGFYNMVRSTTKLSFNNAGALASNSVNAPAFTFDPVSGAIRGLTVEEAISNLVLQSGSALTTWVASQGSVSATSPATGPDGSNMYLVIPNTTNAAHFISQTVTNSTLQPYTMEVWAKAGAYSKVILSLLNLQTPADTISAFFDLTAGTVISSAAGGTGALIGSQATITAYPNGVFKLTLTGQPSTNSNQTGLSARFGVLSPTGGQAFVGDGTSGVYFGGMSFKASSSPSSYIATTTAAAARAGDGLTIGYPVSQGWLSPAAFTVKMLFRIPNICGPEKKQTLLHWDDGTANNAVDIYNPGGTTNIVTSATAGGVVQFTATPGAFTPAGAGNTTAFSNVMFTVAPAFAAIMNGAGLAQGNGTVPSGLSRFFMGSSDGAGANALNGEIRDFNVYNQFVSGDLAGSSAFVPSSGSASP